MQAPGSAYRSEQGRNNEGKCLPDLQVAVQSIDNQADQRQRKDQCKAGGMGLTRRKSLFFKQCDRQNPAAGAKKAVEQPDEQSKPEQQKITSNQKKNLLLGC